MKTISRLLFVFLAGLALCQGQPVISTVAGNGSLGYSGDNGPALSAQLSIPTDMAVDKAGNIYIVDRGNSVVRKVDTTGKITAFAGNGKMGYTGDGGPATAAELFLPVAIAVDSAGNVFIGDSGSNGIRKVDTSGTISTFIPFESATGLTFDSSGNLYITDHNDFIYKVSPSGAMTTIVNRGEGFSGDGGPAFTAAIQAPGGIAVDKSGNIYFADSGNNRVRKIDTSGIITTVAGQSGSGFTGDGGLATSAKLGLGLTYPTQGVALDDVGNLYIADPQNNRIRIVNLTTGIINTYAGNGNAFLTKNGDGMPPLSASVLQPNGVRVDSAGNIFIADTNHSLIREVVGGAASGTGSSGPVITDVENGASFLPGAVANSWVTIKGTNLAPVTDNWSNSIVNGALPTSLDGVSVSMGGRPAYMYYITPGQLNVLAPDISPGPVSVTVKTPSGTSAAVTATVSAYGPAFFLWPGSQVVATRQDYSYAVKAGTFAGATTVAAKPGDVLILWGTGFGPTTPLAPDGVVVPGTASYSTSSVSVTVDNLPATVYGGALASGSVGLYQVAIQVPAALTNGDWPIQAKVGGVASPSGAVLSVSP